MFLTMFRFSSYTHTLKNNISHKTATELVELSNKKNAQSNNVKVSSKTDDDDNEDKDTTTKSSSPRKIYVRYAYIPFISDICTTAQTFDLRIDYDLYWDTTKEEREKWEELKKEGNLHEYSPAFKPALVLQNAIDLPTNDAQDQPEGGPWVIRNEPSLFGNDRPMNFVRYEVRGTFQQKMKTVHFPFDCQVLYIHMCVKYQTVTKDSMLVPCTDFETKKPNKVFYLLTKYNSIQDWDIVENQCGGEFTGFDGYPWCTFLFF